MLLPILATLSFLLASYAASKLASGKRGGPQGQQEGGQQDGSENGELGGEGNNSSSGGGQKTETRHLNPQEMIRKVVQGVRFSTNLRSISVQVGEKLIEVNHPADEISVRPMRSMGEISQILPREHVYPDDLFYGKMARRSLLVRQELARQGVFEERLEEQAKELLVVQDVSGSMEGERIRWALRLNLDLLHRCRAEDVRYRMLAFSNTPENLVEAVSQEDFTKAKHRLPEVLRAGGGTNIDLAINSILDRAQEDGEDTGPSQRRMVLVTDGTEGVSPNTSRRLREMKVNLHAIVIGQDNYTLRKIADHYDYLEIAGRG